MWGAEEEDFKEDLRGLPLERMTGEESFLGIGDPGVRVDWGGSMGDRGERGDEEEEGNGTES
jgi:hypothetical protein